MMRPLLLRGTRNAPQIRSSAAALPTPSSLVWLCSCRAYSPPADFSTDRGGRRGGRGGRGGGRGRGGGDGGFDDRDDMDFTRGRPELDPFGRGDDPQAALGRIGGAETPKKRRLSSADSGGGGAASSRVSRMARNTQIGGGKDEPMVKDPNDPYKDLNIWRQDMATEGSPNFEISVDLNQKKLKDLFNDYDAKRCKLCNETYTQWHSHSNFIPHTARDGIMMEMLRAYQGTADEVVAMWWHRLDKSPVFPRISSLSHSNSNIRRRRLHFLLKYLRDIKVIRESFNVAQANHPDKNTAGRTWEFERLEWVGDNVVKYIFNDRFNCIFPVREGGIRGKLGYAQFMIDGNDGLARAYDFLNMQKLTESDRVISKFKSDVVETLFGELQLYLWSSEVYPETEFTPFPYTSEMVSARALAAHAMHELAHVMFMYHIEYILSCVKRAFRENGVEYTSADPALKKSSSAEKRDRVNQLYQVTNYKKSGYQMTKTKEHFPIQLIRMTHTDYEPFDKVLIGGFLPTAFQRHELSVSPLFMPHAQSFTINCSNTTTAATAAADAEEEEAASSDEAATAKSEKPATVKKLPVFNSFDLVSAHCQQPQPEAAAATAAGALCFVPSLEKLAVSAKANGGGVHQDVAPKLVVLGSSEGEKEEEISQRQLQAAGNVAGWLRERSLLLWLSPDEQPAEGTTGEVATADDAA